MGLSQIVNVDLPKQLASSPCLSVCTIGEHLRTVWKYCTVAVGEAVFFLFPLKTTPQEGHPQPKAPNYGWALFGSGVLLQITTGHPRKSSAGTCVCLKWKHTRAHTHTHTHAHVIAAFCCVSFVSYHDRPFLSGTHDLNQTYQAHSGLKYLTGAT